MTNKDWMRAMPSWQALSVALVLACAMPTAVCAQSLLRDADARASRDQPEVRPLSASFDTASVESVWVAGQGHLRGVLFYRPKRSRLQLVAGRAVPIIGADVYLFPYSEQMAEYATEYQEVIRRGRPDHRGRPQRPLELQVHPDMLRFNLRGKTDEYGRFAFEGIGPGRYILLSTPSVDESRQESQAVQTGTMVSHYGLVQTPIYERQNYNVNYRIDTHGFLTLDVGEGAPVEVEFEVRPVF